MNEFPRSFADSNHQGRPDRSRRAKKVHPDARIGSPGEYIDYAASKGAIDTLTRGLALEVAGDNIRVNCVRPGLIYTDIHRDGGEPDRVERLGPKMPLKRGGTPEEVAAAIAWLLSDEASYVTSAFLDIAGGR